MSDQRCSVSVVIPAFNAERFLAGAIQSALSQSVPPLEIIVVDDGSTDRTAEVAERFGPPVRCARQENGGPSAARNRGIREARGEFIAFLDADDRWLPVHLAEATRVLVAYPHLRWFAAAYETETVDRARVIRRVYTGPLVEEAYFEDSFRAMALYRIGCTDVMVVRRDVLLEVGGFCEAFSHGEDRDLWFRIALRYPQIGYSRVPAAVYRHCRSDSLMALQRNSSGRALMRVQRLDDLAAQAGPAAAKRSEPLFLLRLHTLIRHAISENDQDVLAQIRRGYGKRLKTVDRLLLLLCRIVSSEAIRKVDAAVIAVKRCFWQWWSRIRPAERRPSPVERVDPSPGGGFPPPGARP